jgi:hypothetical protein
MSNDLDRFQRVGRLLLYQGRPVRLASVIAGTPAQAANCPVSEPDGKGSPDHMADSTYNPAAQLARLRRDFRRNNHFRHWLMAYWHYGPKPDPTCNDADYNPAFSPFLYRGGKWDVSNFSVSKPADNTGYFLRLKQLIEAARAQGVVVQLVLFDRSGLDVDMPAKEKCASRWTNNPWNHNRNHNDGLKSTPGVPTFYDRTKAMNKLRFEDGRWVSYPTTLGALQDAYVTKVVQETCAYWNVFYEIMNEPIYSTPDVRTGWANAIAAAIAAALPPGIRRIVLYNDHSGGADMSSWRAHQSTLTQYSRIDGVALHANKVDILSFDPDTSGFDFAAEKVFQVSSDTAPGDLRGTCDWNRNVTNHAFDPGVAVIFQAHSNTNNAAHGIATGYRPPSELRHWGETASTWNPVAGAARDVGIGGEDSVWVIGTDALGDGFRVYRWNGAGFSAQNAGGVRIAAGPLGNAWVVTGGGAIYRYAGGQWVQHPGTATDVAVGADGSLWRIGTNAVGGGYDIYRWNAGTSVWELIDGGAVRIAVGPDGLPWVVNSTGSIYRRTAGGWILLPGAARDIGVGADGSAWIIGTNPVGGGYGIYRWNGSAWEPIDGGAAAISVGTEGLPWVVNDGGAIYRRLFT